MENACAITANFSKYMGSPMRFDNGLMITLYDYVYILVEIKMPNKRR